MDQSLPRALRLAKAERLGIESRFVVFGFAVRGYGTVFGAGGIWQAVLWTDVTQAHIAPCVSGIVGKHSGVLFGRVAPSSQNGSDGCASAPAPS